jgi:predicted phage tail protein
MLTVRLHGHLEEKYGAEFKFAATTVREVIDALQANFPDFTEEFVKDERAYNILVDHEMQNIEGCVQPIKLDSTVDVVPIIAGAGNALTAIGSIIIGALLVIYAPYLAGYMFGAAGAGTAAAGGAAVAGVYGLGVTLGGAIGATVSAIGAIGWGLALAGVASLLAGPDGPDGDGKAYSSLSNTENVIGQGMAVPIGYGRMMVGSIVLSASYASSLVKISPAYTYKNTETGTWVDRHLAFGQEWDGSELTAADDGYVFPYTVTYDGGYSSINWSLIQQYWEAYAAGGEYKIVNFTPVAGTSVPVLQYVAPVSPIGTLSDSIWNVRQ